MTIMKLIDKDALVTEIERKIQFYYDDMNNYKSDISKTALGLCIEEDKTILSFLDTLEVKEENDLENLFQALPEKIVDEKSHQVYELSIYHYDGQCVVDYVGEIDHDSLYTFDGNTLYEAIEKAWNWLFKNSTGG